MSKVYRISGDSEKVYNKIGPFAMDHEVIYSRGNLPIITKSNYTWHILEDSKGNIQAFVASELTGISIKLQSFVIINKKASKDKLIKDVINNFKKSDRPKLTASVLNEDVKLFKKHGFKIAKEKTNWTDLIMEKDED